jgi:hypothetical protein
MGACKVSAYVTHGVFPKKSWERFNHDNGGMELAIVHIFYSSDDYVVVSVGSLTRGYLLVTWTSISETSMWSGALDVLFLSLTAHFELPCGTCRGCCSWVCSLLDDRLVWKYGEGCQGERTFWDSEPCEFNSCCTLHLRQGMILLMSNVQCEHAGASIRIFIAKMTKFQEIGTFPL